MTGDTERDLVLTSLADDELVIGHRASHWTGVAPTIELDLAFATIAQDELNHADVWYRVLLGLPPVGPAEGVDALALGRSPGAYRHAAICAQAPGDFGHTLVRHWLYDLAETVRLEALLEVDERAVRDTAEKLLHEERYHLEHARIWTHRLAGDDPSRATILQAVTDNLALAPGLFEPVAGPGDWLPRSMDEQYTTWRARVLGALGELDLEVDEGLLPPDTSAQLPGSGGRRGSHTAAFTEDVWPEMTALHREHAGARW